MRERGGGTVRDEREAGEVKRMEVEDEANGYVYKEENARVFPN